MHQLSNLPYVRSDIWDMLQNFVGLKLVDMVDEVVLTRVIAILDNTVALQEPLVQEEFTTSIKNVELSKSLGDRNFSNKLYEKAIRNYQQGALHTSKSKSTPEQGIFLLRIVTCRFNIQPINYQEIIVECSKALEIPKLLDKYKKTYLKLLFYRVRARTALGVEPYLAMHDIQNFMAMHEIENLMIDPQYKEVEKMWEKLLKRACLCKLENTKCFVSFDICEDKDLKALENETRGDEDVEAETRVHQDVKADEDGKARENETTTIGHQDVKVAHQETSYNEASWVDLKTKSCADEDGGPSSVPFPWRPTNSNIDEGHQGVETASRNLGPSDTSAPSHISAVVPVVFELEAQEADVTRIIHGETSLSSTYNPNRSIEVAQVVFADANCASIAAMSLQEFGSDLVANVVCLSENKIVIKERDAKFLSDWILEECLKWNGVEDGLWFFHKGAELLRHYGTYAKALITIHKKGFFHKEDGRVLLTKDGLKLLQIAPFVNGKDREYQIYLDLQKFRLEFFQALTVPSWISTGAPLQNGEITDAMVNSLGLPSEVRKVVEHLFKPTVSSKVPKDTYLKHPILLDSTEKLACVRKIHTGLLYGRHRDRIVAKIDENMRLEGDDGWKNRVTDPCVRYLIGYTECDRNNDLKRFLENPILYTPKPPSCDWFLYSDLCKLFFNCPRHIKKAEIGAQTEEEILEYVERQVPEGMTKIYGRLLEKLEDEFKRDPTCLQARDKFLKNLLN